MAVTVIRVSEIMGRWLLSLISYFWRVHVDKSIFFYVWNTPCGVESSKVDICPCQFGHSQAVAEPRSLIWSYPFFLLLLLLCYGLLRFKRSALTIWISSYIYIYINIDYGFYRLKEALLQYEFHRISISISISIFNKTCKCISDNKSNKCVSMYILIFP